MNDINELLEKCINLIISYDKSNNPDCEDENVIALSGLPEVIIMAGIMDMYFRGYSSNKDISDKKEYSDEELKKFSDLALSCKNEIIELDKKLYPDVVDTEQVVSIDALEEPIRKIFETAYKLGEDVQK